MAPMIREVTAELDSRKIKYAKEPGPSPDITRIVFNMDLGDGVNCKYVVIVKENSKTIVILVIFHKGLIPETRRSIAAEMVTRINMKLGVGHIEFDWGSGELRYRVGCPYGKCERYQAIFKDMLLYSLGVSPFFKQIERAITTNVGVRAALGEASPNAQGGSTADALSRDDVIQLLAAYLAATP